MKTKSVKDVIEQPEARPVVACSDLLAALERSIRKCEYANSCTTIVAEIKVGGKMAQVQLKVSRDEDDWFDIANAGIKCS